MRKDADTLAAGLSEWRIMIAGAPPEQRMKLFADATAEAVSFIHRGVERAAVIDLLQRTAEQVGLVDNDAVSAIMKAEIERAPARKPNGGARPQPYYFFEAALESRVPPDWLIDGVLQRHFLYSLTGQTGEGKTAIGLLLAELVAFNLDNDGFLGKHRVRHGRVMLLAGENFDDTLNRLIGANELRRDKRPVGERFCMWPGRFDIDERFSEMAAAADLMGGVDLVLVDTSAVYFLGDEEKENTQMGDHALMMRRLTTLPGGPCVIVLCHPIKHVEADKVYEQLKPRGGGSFLAEVDGNLIVWMDRDAKIATLHFNKIRGPNFEPISIKMETIWPKGLVDREGRMMPTVRASVIEQSEEDRAEGKLREDEDHVLAQLLRDPDRSQAAIADSLGWKNKDGEPQRMRVSRAIDRLKPKFIKETRRNRWELTEAGKKAAREAALSFTRPDGQDDLL